MSLRAPFPWFGGKSRAASLVWERFGDVRNYVEPFAGSLAVLLARPAAGHVETVNDKDAALANFWRALQRDPEGVARWADWPVNEVDLHARHLWLVTTGAERVQRLMADPDYYDVKVAGWWVWGLCQWIGSGWCATIAPARQLPHLGDAGRGIHAVRGGDISDFFEALSARLRRVRVCCGDWRRVLGPSATEKIGLTGILLDPPYTNYAHLYGGENEIARDVREWALANGDNPMLRIALCGYEGEHEMPESWTCVAWKAPGGYAGQRRDGVNDNGAKERIWFSPHCLQTEQMVQPRLLP